MFPSMPYLEWIVGRPDAATHDLGSSDLRRSHRDSAVVPGPLADLDHPDDPPSLTASLAAEYEVPESRVLVTAGATHANFLAAATALSLATEDRGVESPRALVERPGYGPLVHTPTGLDAAIDRFARPASADYALEADRVADAVEASTAIVTVTNRHNPSGRLAERETLAALGDAAGDAHLLVDEVYAPYVTTESEPSAFGGVTAAGLPRTVVTGSLTKFHGLGGLKIGWLIGPERVVDRARSIAAHVPAVAEPSRALARRFFAHRDDLVAASREHLRQSHAVLSAFVDDREDLTGRIHDGCSFGFVAHESADGSTVAEAAWERDVLVIPGRFFGDDAGFRLSVGRDPEEAEQGLAVLGEVLDDL